ncbi:MAG: hypothetical protein ACJ75B_08225 [Flavisolibacter sp.]
MISSLPVFGRWLFGLATAVVGVLQLCYADFVQMIFPAWPHTFPGYRVIACLFSVFMVVVGLLAAAGKPVRRSVLILGGLLLVGIAVGQIPFLYLVVPYDKTNLGVWDAALKELAIAGGAFLLAGLLPASRQEQGAFDRFLQGCIPMGRYFFCFTMMLYGYAHFLYHNFTVVLVPHWIPGAGFWVYATGAALMAAGLSIGIRVWDRIAALLLGLMIFIWFWIIHLPHSLTNFPAGRGEMAAALSALMFSGTAFMLTSTRYARSKIRNRNSSIDREPFQQHSYNV